MRMAVCPHDIVKQMKTWLEVARYLGARLGEPLTLEPVTDFDLFYREALPYAELAFVNPMDAWTLYHERGFLPLFRTELFDEVVFITHPDNTQATLENLQGQPIAAVDRQFATYLGLYLLQERGIQVAGLVWKPSWLQVIRAIMKGEVLYGLLYQDFYTGLTQLAREQVRVLYESQTRYATHMMLLHPEREDVKPALVDHLAAMHEDPEGAALLQTLRLGRWVPVSDLGAIERIVTVQVPGAARGG